MNSKVSISASSPWDISFPLDEVSGFDETKCVECTSTAGFTFKLDKIRIKVFHQNSIELCGWLKVRQIPNGKTTWFAAEDQLKGTHVNGDPTDDTQEWSIQFDNIPFNQFMFANEFFTKWIVVDKEEVIPEFS